jgi:hypothetical protein
LFTCPIMSFLCVCFAWTPNHDFKISKFHLFVKAKLRSYLQEAFFDTFSWMWPHFSPLPHNNEEDKILQHLLCARHCLKCFAYIN